MSDVIWTAKMIRAVEKAGIGEALCIKKIRAAALLYLDERDQILCEMNADEEWPIGSGIKKKRNKRMKMLYRMMIESASEYFNQDSTDSLVSEILHQTCEKLKYTAVVWNIEPLETLKQNGI